MPYKNKSDRTAAKRRHREKYKRLAIERAGGVCKRCGYNACDAVLEFHHKDPGIKKFQISDGNDRSLQDIYNEIDKCILLCSNCHRELHYGVWKIEEITTT